jgi:hypothetical protein
MCDGVKTQIMSMPDVPTLDEIDQLIRAPADTPITLWTMQQAELLARRSNIEAAVDEMPDPPNFKTRSIALGGG